MPYPHMPSMFADQRFTRTCTGAETDTFVQALPTTRADTNYIATVTLLSGVGPSSYACRAAPSGYTTSQITIVCDVPPVAGDILGIEIKEKNS